MTATAGNNVTDSPAVQVLLTAFSLEAKLGNPFTTDFQSNGLVTVGDVLVLKIFGVVLLEPRIGSAGIGGLYAGPLADGAHCLVPNTFIELPEFVHGLSIDEENFRITHDRNAVLVNRVLPVALVGNTPLDNHITSPAESTVDGLIDLIALKVLYFMSGAEDSLGKTGIPARKLFVDSLLVGSDRRTVSIKEVVQELLGS